MDISEQIYSQYTDNTKSLFKVWHFIQNKDYDYNTEFGIQKYRTFVANLKVIREHNASNNSYTKGINQFTDMTEVEVKQHFNLKPMNMGEVRRHLRSMSLDNFNDDEEVVVPNTPNTVNGTHKAVDWRSKMRPVRNQGTCGSCWAYTTNSVLEGCYAAWKGGIADWISTQHPVDCDSGNGGCNGGWYNNAFEFFVKTSAVWEKDYPYTGVRGTCKTTTKKANLQISGYKYFNKGYSSTGTMAEMMARGPVATAVDANQHWFSYKGGVFNGACSSGVNHAVTIVGFGVQEKTECKTADSYFIIRNSWGVGWGEEGHIKIKHDDNNSFSCNIDKFGYQATSFR